jgi:EAL and modified HD-GYP domain-containing signal transduction protein
VAYELLFREGNTTGVVVTDDARATASVIDRTFHEMGARAVLGARLGFINVSAEVLLSDMLENLPPSRVVLEILETVTITDAITARCRFLKQRGFTLALDDFVYNESYRPLLELVDIVKLDLLAHSREELRAAVAHLRQWPVKLLAEKVDSAEQAAYCRGLGFDLFQGYYYAKPSVLSTTSCGPGQSACRPQRVKIRIPGTNDDCPAPPPAGLSAG